MKPTIQKNDILEWAKNYDGPKFHALLCDPPYHLTSIVKRFGTENAAPAKHGKDGAFSRASSGFMGKTWDGGMTAFDPATWHAIGQHMHAGAFGMAFASSRGWHRLAVAIEDAGFIIHPSVFVWTYGSGFPKATRIDNQVDRELGKEEERRIIGKGSSHGATSNSKRNLEHGIRQYKHGIPEEYNIEEPATEQAQAWAGHRYGAQALKPAAEPLIVFQKPYEGRPIENMMETGAGALNIDAGRVGNVKNVPASPSRATESVLFNTLRNETGLEDGHNPNVGRWPANFLVQHHPACRIIGESEDSFNINRFTDGAKPFGNGAGHDYESQAQASKQYAYSCHPDCPSRKLGEQSGNLKSGKLEHHHNIETEWGYHGGHRDSKSTANSPGDSGTASRFFYQADWSHEIYEQLESADPVYYCAKASQRERNAGLDGIEPTRSSYRPNDPDENSICTRLHRSQPRKNPHPTVKPIELARYLASLLLPPESYAPDRRILVPFAGVASEMIGCMLAGWDEVVGVELDEDDEYIPIAQKRIDWWHTMMKAGNLDPKEIIKIKPPKKVENQLDLF